MKNKKTTLNRREFIRLNTAALTGAILTPALVSGKESEREATSSLETEPLGFYRFGLGDLKITVINDGFFQLSEITPPEMQPIEGLALNTSEESRQEYFGSRLLDSENPRLLISPILIESGDRRVLVDSGWSMPGASETAGRLDSSLEMLGIARESIDTVVVTHAHPDHIGGLIDPATKSPIYPNAEVVITETELEFWKSDAVTPLLESPLLDWIPNVLETLDEQLSVINAGDEIMTGIRSIPSPGHTPGHICLGIEAGGRELLLTGDAVVNIHASFERPDWHNFFDFEQEQAGKTRREILDRAATDEMLILGYHFPFPGLGYAICYNGAYRWHPAGATIL